MPITSYIVIVVFIFLVLHLCDRALNMQLSLIVVQFETLGQTSDNLLFDHLVIFKGIMLQVEHSQSFEHLQGLDKVDDLHFGEADLIVSEDHLHDIDIILVFAL